MFISALHIILLSQVNLVPQGRILMEILGKVEKFRGGAVAPMESHDPLRMGQSQRRDVCM
jgi:hypothetical protein